MSEDRGSSQKLSKRLVSIIGKFSLTAGLVFAPISYFFETGFNKNPSKEYLLQKIVMPGAIGVTAVFTILIVRTIFQIAYHEELGKADQIDWAGIRTAAKKYLAISYFIAACIAGFVATYFSVSIILLLATKIFIN